ncbi:hypothetical protein L1987_12036 [Smallanthus sonchifolius]|uniref:Uncharacterized protein n=1 Tax=Smallanthus sonchifolius TaxID=185202 RepID=A0ACB9JE70_9ASTR|nr:hypothetical protein L1987_12036 [Smallanthus sonchifolius]
MNGEEGDGTSLQVKKIHDTSVLVRLRPSWEDLRSYLIAKERKQFEVYICTMAERDYALEMWRVGFLQGFMWMSGSTTKRRDAVFR